MNSQSLRRHAASPERRFTLSIAHADPAIRWLLLIVAVSLTAGTLMAAVLPGWIGVDRATVSAPTKTVSSHRDTGAMPMYELPPVAVEAHRATELARISREEESDRVRQARSKGAAKPPV